MVESPGKPGASFIQKPSAPPHQTQGHGNEASLASDVGGDEDGTRRNRPRRRRRPPTHRLLALSDLPRAKPDVTGRFTEELRIGLRRRQRIAELAEPRLLDKHGVPDVFELYMVMRDNLDFLFGNLDELVPEYAAALIPYPEPGTVKIKYCAADYEPIYDTLCAALLSKTEEEIVHAYVESVIKLRRGIVRWDDAYGDDPSDSDASDSDVSDSIEPAPPLALGRPLTVYDFDCSFSCFSFHC